MSDTPYLYDVLVFLAAAVLVVSLFRSLHAGPVLGYLVAGMLIGPFGLGIIEDVEATRDLAKLGVVFLLFTIGLELSFARLKAMRFHVFGLGTAQVAISGLALGALAWILGADAKAAILIGAALALSSTAIVLQILSERGEIASHAGRISLAILLLQDLAVVPLLLLVPLLGEEQASIPAALGLAGLKAAALVGIVLIGRLLVRPLFRVIAAQRSPELLVALALLVVLGTSWATELAGLTLALGAFLAGLLLAETEFRHQVEADIQPFRGILLGLFFMTVGMSMDLGLAVGQALPLAAIVVGLILVKTVTIAALCRLFGLSSALSLGQGLLLSQGGEFAFVLFGLGLSFGVLAYDTGQLLLLGVAVTMALTPLLAALGRRISDALAREDRGGVGRLAEEAEDLRNHVLIAGFGRVGQTIAKLLTASQVPYIALDLEARRIAEGRNRGLPVYYGDASQPNVLRAAGAERARAAAITIDNPRGAARAVALLRQHFPDLKIFVRARDRAHIAELHAAGADAIVPEAMEASLQLAGQVLRSAGSAEHEVPQVIDEFRREDYAALAEVIPAEGKARGQAADAGAGKGGGGDGHNAPPDAPGP